jgi:hypothetical protein
MQSLLESNNGEPGPHKLRPKHISPVNVEQTEALLAASPKQGRPFEPGNTAAAGRRPIIARGGIKRMAESGKGDPRLRVHLKRGEQYRRARMRELTQAHGFVSCGVGAMIATEAKMLALGEYFMELGSEGEGTPELLLKSASFAKDARTLSLSAWELCAREAVAARKDLKPGDRFLSGGE